MHHHYHLCTTFLSKQVLVWSGFGNANSVFAKPVEPRDDEWSQGSEDGTFGEKEGPVDGPNICPHIFSYTFFLLRSTSSPDFEIQALFWTCFFPYKIRLLTHRYQHNTPVWQSDSGWTRCSSTSFSRWEEPLMWCKLWLIHVLVLSSCCWPCMLPWNSGPSSSTAPWCPNKSEKWKYTPRKWNFFWEPKNWWLADVSPFARAYFQVPC